jgi:hypothetical protein
MQLEWPAYAVDCSESDEGSGMLCVAVASFVPSRVNHVRLYHKITLTEDDEGEEEDYDLRPMGLPLPFDFVATKLKFVPGGTLKGTDSEFLAVAGLGVTLWRRDGHNLWSPAAKLVATPGALRRGSNPHLSNNNSSQGTSNGSNAGGKNPPAPVTSFDWSRADNHLLVTGSFDTTCTVWDVATSAVRTQLIAHDKEVYDVACSAASPDLFVSVGGEGSLRMFDTRYLLQALFIHMCGCGCTNASRAYPIVIGTWTIRRSYMRARTPVPWFGWDGIAWTATLSAASGWMPAACP